MIMTHCSLCFLVSDAGSHCVAQTGLELLVSSDPPTLTSQNARIKGLGHSSWPQIHLCEAQLRDLNPFPLIRSICLLEATLPSLLNSKTSKKGSHSRNARRTHDALVDISWLQLYGLTSLHASWFTNHEPDTGSDGQPRGFTTPMICPNPLTAAFQGPYFTVLFGWSSLKNRYVCLSVCQAP
ncbi:hypothetical protein AAY473_011544 [Plecturocebus cupreus]